MSTALTAIVAKAIEQAGKDWLKTRDPDQIKLGFSDIPEEVFAEAAIKAIVNDRDLMSNIVEAAVGAYEAAPAGYGVDGASNAAECAVQTVIEQGLRPDEAIRHTFANEDRELNKTWVFDLYAARDRLEQK
jgi:hypothetical protein